MRSNPDGTMPTATRFLGFANTVDLTAVLTLDKAHMVIKVDGTSQDIEIDFTAADDITKVTVAEAMTALNGKYTAPVITFSADTDTGRLKGVSASGTYVQVTGALAAALDFGQGLTQGGNGLEFIKIFNDRTSAVGLAKNKKDKEEIDTEGAKGTIKRMVISPKLQGVNITLGIVDKDYELLELIQGGTYNRTDNTYEPPTSNRQESPVFWGELYSKYYGEGTNKMEDSKFVEKQTINSCTGMESDVPIEAKAWAKYGYDVIATEYTDEADVLHPAWTEAVLTKAQYLALDVENV
jgi:hypothetical protein